MPDAAQTSREAALQTLFEALQPLSLAPLWTQYRAMLTPTPQGRARPYLWRYAELRPHLLRTGELISTREAERRVLMNPGLEGQAAAASTLKPWMSSLLSTPPVNSTALRSQTMSRRACIISPGCAQPMPRTPHAFRPC
jgi:gentisate 1,2-dioxygenase